MKILAGILQKIRGFSKKAVTLAIISLLIIGGTVIIRYSVLQENIKNQTAQENENKYAQYLAIYEQNFKDEKYQEALTALNNANCIKKVENYDEKYALCKMYDSSMNNYNNGVQYFDSKKYLLALDAFKLVNAKDESRYKVAQEKINECNSLAISQAIEEAKACAAKGDYLNAKNTLQPYQDNEEAKILMTQYESKIPKTDNRSYSPSIEEKENVRIGMTEDEVLNSNWGKPQKVNRTITKYGTNEQWVYSIGRYLYFDDGILTTIQD